jgi:hypothetical protein
VLPHAWPALNRRRSLVQRSRMNREINIIFSSYLKMNHTKVAEAKKEKMETNYCIGCWLEALCFWWTTPVLTCKKMENKLRKFIKNNILYKIIIYHSGNLQLGILSFIVYL